MTYDDRSRFRFAPPEEIAARTGARSVRGGFKDGLCPSCGESKLKVAWGRDRGRTIVRCHADAPCQQTEVLSAFSKQGLSLVIKGADAADPGKPRRHLSETAGLDPIDRALWHLSKAELRLYQWLKRRGDGPAKFRDMPFGRSAKRAAPVLEHLGLVRVKRGRFDPNGGGREANGYEVARVRPFHPLPPEDSLRALRRSLKQNLNDGAQPFYTCTSSSHGATVAPIRTCRHRRFRRSWAAESTRSSRTFPPPPSLPSGWGRHVRQRRGSDGSGSGRWDVGGPMA